MSKMPFVIEPHFGLHELVTEQKGDFRDAGAIAPRRIELLSAPWISSWHHRPIVEVATYSGRKNQRVKKSFWGVARTFAVLLAGFAASAAQAHHSFAMFDHDRQIKLAGTVSHFQWTNPHVYIDLAVAPDSKSGAASDTHYTIECANPGILNRSGWTWNILKPGDKITVVIAPLRSGQPGGLLKEVTLADGRKLDNGGPAGKASIDVEGK